MSNSWFQFKQFMIRQDRCAMKVCTDACIFGAWCSGRIMAGARVLDIGSGTGLLMLMLAQRHEGGIEGIEIDPDAFGQLQENIAQSPWNERIRAYLGDVREFSFPGKFDFIITNPPFFEDDLPADTGAKNLARHSTALKLSELITVLDANLASAGSFCILLPFQRAEYFEGLATTRGFHLLDQLRLRQRAGDDPFRAILHFSRKEIGPAGTSFRTSPTAAAGASSGAIPAAAPDVAPVNELIIRDEDGNYTEEFVELMKDYYLYL